MSIKWNVRRGPARWQRCGTAPRRVSGRLSRLFLRDDNGARPTHGGNDLYRDDPHWRDLVLFYEYFHGDSGAGLGASHQTGWTGLVAKLLQQWSEYAGQGRPPDVSA